MKPGSTAKARARHKRIMRELWICRISITTIVVTVGTASYAGGWPGFVVTFGGACVVALAITILLATVLPDDIKWALRRGWLWPVPANITTVELQAGKTTTGEEAREEVRVKRVALELFQVIHSPGLVLGIAAGDVIKLHTADTGSFDIVKRGQNLCIQIFKGEQFSNSERDQFARRMQEIQGRLDGASANELVFTVPARLGFAKVESLLNSLVSECQDCRWYFGNVYDPMDGVTPLNWWVRWSIEPRVLPSPP